jgi:hypothetical protein
VKDTDVFETEDKNHFTICGKLRKDVRLHIKCGLE